MPLIIVTGLPTSGKTTRAKQLHAYLAARIASSSQQHSPHPPHPPQQNPTTQGTPTTPPTAPNSPPTAPNSPPPASAPTTFQPAYRLHLISDTTLSIPRAAYDLSPSTLPAHVRSANASEKDARAALYGAVKRVLSPRDIVVLDGLNYIKGWRYQLYCEAKNVRTGSCVLQVGCGVERARGVNEARLHRKRRREPGGDGGNESESGREAGTRDARGVVGGEEGGRIGVDGGGEQQQQDDGVAVPGTDTGKEDEKEAEHDASSSDEEPYTPSNWDNLVFRYEEPNPMTRWDSPLFTLIWEDDAARTRAVFDQIWDAVAGDGRKAVKPNQSTVQRDKDPGGDYLYVLERETQDIVKRILERQPAEGGGGAVSLPRVNNSPGDAVGAAGGGDELVVELPGKKVGLPQLQRYRRAFVALNRGGIGLEAVGKLAAGRIRESFVGYLNDAFEKDG